MEFGIAASWHCFSSIFLSGAWHLPHQKDTLLDRLQHFVGKSNYLTTSLSSSQWLTLENELNIFLLPHAIRNHTLPARSPGSGFGWAWREGLGFNYYSFLLCKITNPKQQQQKQKSMKQQQHNAAKEQERNKPGDRSRLSLLCKSQHNNSFWEVISEGWREHKELLLFYMV